MHPSLNEPSSSRYIYINPNTNKVHILVPVVGGQEISTDNTCRSKDSLRQFIQTIFEKLIQYQELLQLDFLQLANFPELLMNKTDRFMQIMAYIDAIIEIRKVNNFEEIIDQLLAQEKSNLYSIQLRPRCQDSFSKVINPVFNLNRQNNIEGIPLSALYNALNHFRFDIDDNTTPKHRLIARVLGVLEKNAAFGDIQNALNKEAFNLFGVNIDFTLFNNGSDLTKNAIDDMFEFKADTKPEEYIEVLLNACAINLWETLPESPFYTISGDNDTKKEHFSILVQFFLANLNVYCKAKGISSENFGVILDNSSELSRNLVETIGTALNTKDGIEHIICNFISTNQNAFQLSRLLDKDDLIAINQKFLRCWRTVTGTSENRHMDDFLILDLEASGKHNKFVTHQGSICINFAEIALSSPIPNQDYFNVIRHDFSEHLTEIPHDNPSVLGEIDSCIDNTIKSFLKHVAQGNLECVNEALIKAYDLDRLFQTPQSFIDYSGRRFNCTAYEYAYWAKDTHMCRLLEQHMSDDIKADILIRIKRMDQGLFEYEQDGIMIKQSHFDLAELTTALYAYTTRYEQLQMDGKWDEIEELWMRVGKAQRNLPAHIIAEYCRLDKDFSSIESRFNDEAFSRTFSVKGFNVDGPATLFTMFQSVYRCFPLGHPSEGLGFQFAITRGASLDGGIARTDANRQNAIGYAGWLDDATRDLMAICKLDEVRTADLEVSRNHLSQQSSVLYHSL